ncbi:hypothetical protein [Lentibacillus jeotgali]|uniref:hypothetical protein n=1 Tax=Lentibacillus jeotgali TaxID=558169 RepID=UPI000262589F|nr:hypothetical protein [Lentibacillus jeotgali]
MLQQELKKLKAIKKALNDERHLHQVQKLAVLVAEVLEELKHNELRFFAVYTNTNYMEHIERYQNIARRNKNKALASLQDLIDELMQKRVNIKRCNVLLDALISSEFYTKQTERKLSGWRSLQPKDFIRKYFTV